MASIRPVRLAGGGRSGSASASRRARDHYAQSVAIARDIGLPLQEARALEGIGNCHIHDGNPSLAAGSLRQALVIYQRIGNPGDQRIQQTLRQHEL